MFNPFPLCIDSISFLYWFNLIRSSVMTWYYQFLFTLLHWVQSYDSIQLISILIFKRIEFHSLFRIPFKYLDSDVLHVTFHLEDDEKHSQSCSDKHHWFRPYLTQNTWWRWRPYIPGDFKYFVCHTVYFKPLMWSYWYPVIHLLHKY